MRDLIILAVVLSGAAIAIWRPWIGILLWTWISLMNPHRYAWGIAYDAPVAAIAAVSVLIGTLFTKYRQSPIQGAPSVLLLLFAFWMTISWLMGYDPAGDYPMWDRVIKIYLMTFVALMLLNHKQKIIAFAWVAALSLALLGAKGGLFTLLTGGTYRVWGPPDSLVGGNNEFALALIITIPLLHFLQLQLRPGWPRHLLTVIMVLCAIAALGSHSRGALLAIAAMTALLWWRSEKKLLLGVLIILLVAVFLPFLPEHWWQRMETIRTYEQDASAMGRINAWIVAWEVAKQHFFGGGMSYQHPEFFNLYGVHETIVRAAHSIYFQILGNHGFIGLLLYLSLWIMTYRMAGWLRKNAKAIPQAKWASDLGAMAQVSLVGFAVGGAFLSLAYFDLPYNIMVMVVLAWKWVEARAWETEKDVPLMELLSFKRKPSKEAPAL